LSDWKRKVAAEYVPTDAQRSLVESASAFGITQAEIATQLKISEPTLRKHFRDELDGGVFKANMKVGGNMYALTQSVDEQVRLRACQWWTAGLERDHGAASDWRGQWSGRSAACVYLNRERRAAG
jgi:hypothetical protein